LANQRNSEDSFLSKKFSGARCLCLIVKDRENRRAAPRHHRGIGAELEQPLLKRSKQGMPAKNSLFKVIDAPCSARAPQRGLETIYVIL
jgi:hypothetical protein